MRFIYQLMLRDQVIMCDNRRLRQSSRATAEQSRSRCSPASLQIIESHPVLLAGFQQFIPCFHPGRDLLPEHVEHPDILLWDIGIFGGSLQLAQYFRL